MKIKVLERDEEKMSALVIILISVSHYRKMRINQRTNDPVSRQNGT